jgi:hypothetical protein
MGVESTDANPYIQGSNGIGNNAKKLLLNPFGGNVGIGEDTPELTLHIRDGALATPTAPNGNCDVVIEGTTTTGIQFLSDNQTQLRFGSSGSTGDGSIIYKHDIDTLTFNTTDDFRFGVAGGAGYVLHLFKDGQIDLGNDGVNKAEFCKAGNNHYVVGQAADNVAALEVYSQHGSSYNKISFGVYDNRTGTKSASFLVRGDGTVLDGKGPLRNVPTSPLSGTHAGGYVMLASDSGKCVAMSGDVTLQSVSGGGPFGGGDVITILNASASAITLNQGTGLTLYNSGTGNTGNCTLGPRGIATVIYMYGGNSAYISGAQLT